MAFTKQFQFIKYSKWFARRTCRKTSHVQTYNRMLESSHIRWHRHAATLKFEIKKDAASPFKCIDETESSETAINTTLTFWTHLWLFLRRVRSTITSKRLLLLLLLRPISFFVAISVLVLHAPHTKPHHNSRKCSFFVAELMRCTLLVVRHVLWSPCRPNFVPAQLMACCFASEHRNYTYFYCQFRRGVVLVAIATVTLAALALANARFLQVNIQSEPISCWKCRLSYDLNVSSVAADFGACASLPVVVASIVASLSANIAASFRWSSFFATSFRLNGYRRRLLIPVPVCECVFILLGWLRVSCVPYRQTWDMRATVIPATANAQTSMEESILFFSAITLVPSTPVMANYVLVPVGVFPLRLRFEFYFLFIQISIVFALGAYGDGIIQRTNYDIEAHQMIRFNSHSGRQSSA